MNKDIEKYVGYYFSVYLIVLFICGFFQYFAVCNGQSLECAFSMEGLNTIITTTAYVLTPIVAIIALLTWKLQHNKLTLANEAKSLIKAIDGDLKPLSYIKLDLKKLNPKMKLSEQEAVLNILDILKKLPKNQNKITSRNGLFYNLSGDEKLKLSIENYQNIIFKIASNSVILVSEDLEAQHLMAYLITSIDKVILVNGSVKRHLKTYVIMD